MRVLCSWWVLVATLAAACSTPRSPVEPAPSSRPAQTTTREEWYGRPLIVRGRLAAVYVERALYRRPDLPDGFLVSIWVRNLVDRTIGIEGTGERWFVHPNQWSVGDEPARTAVNERTLVPRPLDGPRREELKARFTAGMPQLEAGSSLQSYEAFDGSSPKDVDQEKGRWLILSFDGQVFVTDGTDSESLEAKADGQTAADLTLAAPIAWQDLPPPPAK